MTSKLLPALGAALLLAACGSGNSDQSQPQTSQLAETGAKTPVVPGDIPDQNGFSNVGNAVYFETDSYSLNPEAQTQLQKEATWMQQYPQHTFTIEGHADERGTREYNLALGERRAEAVVNYLTALGVSATRLKEISYGKEKPICVDSTETCWSQNRRGVTAIDQ